MIETAGGIILAVIILCVLLPIGVGILVAVCSWLVLAAFCPLTYVALFWLLYALGFGEQYLFYSYWAVAGSILWAALWLRVQRKQHTCEGE